MSNPDVSVVMAVYNAQEYVSDAIESILCQTYNDFEFIIIDDGSSDDSLNIIQTYSDPRIKVIRNKENLKLIKSLNLGLQEARGRYIVRMDADDVSRPDRIEKQIIYMDSHPDCVLCGTSYRTFGDGVTSRNIVYPGDNQSIRYHMLSNTHFLHPSTCYRREVVEKQLLKYSEDFLHVEDHWFFFELLHHGKGHIMKEVLLDYRIHGQNVSVIHTANQLSTQNTIRIKIAEHYGLTFNTNKEVKEYLSFLLVMKPQPHQESSVELSGDCGIFLTLLDNLKILLDNSHNEVVSKNTRRAIRQIVPLLCGFRWKDFRAILDHPLCKEAFARNGSRLWHAVKCVLGMRYDFNRILSFRND